MAGGAYVMLLGAVLVAYVSVYAAVHACDESCLFPSQEGFPWSVDREAWQWTAQAVPAGLGVLAALVVWAAAAAWRPRLARLATASAAGFIGVWVVAFFADLLAWYLGWLLIAVFLLTPLLRVRR